MCAECRDGALPPGLCSKPLAGGGIPMREEAWILQFTHVERWKHSLEPGEHSLERGKTKWSTHTQPEYRIRCHVLFSTQVLT